MSGGKGGKGGKGSGGSKRACCMVSEILEETGIDRERMRQIRRQLLEGIVLMCQWQLQRMQEEAPAEPAEPAAARARRGRKIQVE